MNRLYAKLKKILSIFALLIVVTGIVGFIEPKLLVDVEAVTENQQRIVNRANYMYDSTWVSQKTIYGWNYKHTFNAGGTYHLPYAWPVTVGAYIGYGISVEDFLVAAADVNNKFYTTRSYLSGTSYSYSTYYGSDCSSFVSWCWGIGRNTTYTIPDNSTYIGEATVNNCTRNLQLGDALNDLDSHVILVTGLTYNSSGAITQIEITEQTPPQLKRSTYTPSELSSKYYGNYQIYRYKGEVPEAPNKDEEKPVISDVVYSNVSAAGYTISCKVTDNVSVQTVAFPTWTVANGQDDLASNFMVTQAGIKNGDIYTFEVKASDHNNEGGFYATHIYAKDRAGNTTSLTLNAVEVRDDKQGPVISDVVYSNVSAAGYTISCRVVDDWGLSNVAFPTWTTTNGQDDLPSNFFVTQQGTNDGDIYTFNVKTSDHNNEGGFYATHIYATDCAGNRVSLPLEAVEVRDDKVDPVISDAKITNVTSTGYTVSCKVTDDWGLNSVAFPTWTVANGQDDLAEQFMQTQKGVKDGDTYTFEVKTSDHNNELGFYATHIYARDCAGNTVSLPLEAVEVTDQPVEEETITVKPTEKETTEKPSEETTTVKPTEKETTAKPAEKETTNKPSEEATPDRPSEKETTNKPSEEETTNKPSEEETTDKPSVEEPTEQPETDIVDAQKAVIIKKPAGATYYCTNKAKALSVEAKVTDGGTLSYQWYKNKKKNTTGATKISGATERTYLPDTKQAGSYYYYCIVTNTNTDATGKQVSLQNSGYAKIQVRKLANKITNVSSSYKKSMDDTTFKLSPKASGTIKYKTSNAKVVEVSSDGTVTIKGIGSAKITVTAGNDIYQTATKTLNVRVVPKTVELTSIASNAKKALSIKWEKMSGISGFKIQYSLTSDFKEVKTSYVGSFRHSKTRSDHIAGKKYYVRVCAYKKIGKTTYQGAYSDIKNCIVIKK